MVLSTLTLCCHHCHSSPQLLSSCNVPIKHQLHIPPPFGLAPSDQHSTVCLCGYESVSECDSYTTHCWVSSDENEKVSPTQQVSDGFSGILSVVAK